MGLLGPLSAAAAADTCVALGPGPGFDLQPKIDPAADVTMDVMAEARRTVSVK